MALRDRLLPAVARADRLVQRLGLNPYTCVVRVESYDKPLARTASLIATTDLALVAPPPAITRLDAEAASVFGGGSPMADATGHLFLAVFRVGPVTPAYSARSDTGGYSIEQLLPAASGPDQRLVYVLAGPGLRAHGEPFEVVQFDGNHPLGYVVTVRRAPVFTLTI